MRRIIPALLFVLLLVVFAVCLIWPIWQTVQVGFFGVPATNSTGPAQHFTLQFVAAIFRDQQLRRGLFHSTAIAIAVTFLCTLISLPLAVLGNRYDFFGKTAVSGLLLVPLVLPPFVGAIGMRQVLGRFGVLTALATHIGLVAPGAPVDWFGHYRIGGIVLLEALSLYPILYLNVSAALANLDPAMEQAAANLGASRWTIFRRITLPLLRPGLLAGGTIVLIWSFTELGTPLMFDYYDVTPVQIFHQLNQVNGSPLPYALVVVMLVVSVVLYVGSKIILGKSRDVTVSKGAAEATAQNLSFVQSLPVLIPFVLVIGLALLPHISVVLMSFSKVGAWYDSVLPTVFTTAHYATGLTHEITLPSVGNSILFAFCSMIVDLAAGLCIAWLLVRTTLPGRQLLDALAMLPLAVPGIVLAFGYLAISLRLQLVVAGYEKLHGPIFLNLWSPWWGWWRWRLSDMLDVNQNPMLLLIIAYAMRRLPYVVRSVVAGLEQTPVDLELASRNLGASTIRTLRRITGPLIAANLIAGGLLAFAFAMLEVSDSLILAQRQAYWPITKAIYDLFQRLGDGPYIASALGVYAMLLLMLTMLIASSMLGKRMGAIFRI
jgi:iron(III) transport system permease protein